MSADIQGFHWTTWAIEMFLLICNTSSPHENDQLWKWCISQLSGRHMDTTELWRHHFMVEMMNQRWVH